MDGDPLVAQTLEGVLFPFSETGTEGADWAFQDERYIRHGVARGYCKNCGVVLREQHGAVRLTRVTAITGEDGLERRLSELPTCAPGTHEEEVGESWEYEGLHILNDGDRLTIYSPTTREELWSGVIDLQQYDVFTQHAAGLWIHADQRGVDRDTWAKYFFDHCPARLVPANARRDA